MRQRKIARPSIEKEPDGAATGQTAISIDSNTYLVAPASDDCSAHTWLAAWAAAERKTVTDPIAENSEVGYRVLFIGRDGVALDKGRSAAVYPLPQKLGKLAIGAKVFIDEHSQICILNVVETKKGGQGR